MSIEVAESQHPDHRSRRLAERRGRVFDAAIELFVEQGYENTTMDDIANRADVARASVFNYYQRKAAFLDEWSERRRKGAAISAGKIDPDHHDLAGLLKRYMTELAAISDNSRIETVAVMGAAIRTTNLLASPPLAKALTPFFTRGRASGDLRPGAGVESAALLLATGYLATLAAWIDSDPAPFDLGTALLEMLDIVLRGIATER